MQSLPAGEPATHLATPSAEPAPAPAPDASPAPASIARIVLHPPQRDGRFRWEVETMGMATALVDLALSDLAGVVVEVPGVPVDPGAADLLPVGQAWHAWLDLGTDPDALAVRLKLCDPSDSCLALERVASRGHLEVAVPGIVGEVAARMGREPAEGAREGWGAPLSADDYAVLMAGRSAASFYGMREPVAPEERGDKVRDPVARAVFIDPAVAVSQWIAGRRAAADGDWAKARVSFTSAALGRGRSPILSADEAAALAASGNAGAASAAWNTLLEWHADDARFLLPQARAALAAADVPLATSLVEALAVRWGQEPAVAELRVRVADLSGVPADPDPLLAAWQEADPTAAEPVRRRIHLRIRSARYDEALALVPELGRRGQVSEAEQLRMAVAVGLSRWDVAAAAADALGDGITAARIRGRGAIEAGRPVPPELHADADPEIRLVVGQELLEAGDAAGALDRATSVLKATPWQPEALALQARALRALGKVADAEKVERTLRDVEPGRG